MSLRTVEREVQPFRQAWERTQKATMRFETMPGKQMQVDFGEKWLLIGGERQKRYVFVATLGFSRRCYIEIFGSLRQRDWIMGLEHAFRYFDGVPEEVLTDNAKPLVLGRKGGRPQFHLSRDTKSNPPLATKTDPPGCGGGHAKKSQATKLLTP